MKQFEDRLGKFLIGTLFSEITRVEVGTDLLPNAFYADILLIPERPLPLEVPGAGLLTKWTGDARCLVEPFSGSISEVRLEGTLSKLRLALQRTHDDKLGLSYPKGVLWLLVPYWPKTGISRVFGVEGETLEPGLRRWTLGAREMVYMVNTHVIELREETVLFCLLGSGQRKAAVLKIFEEELEPYVSILNAFDEGFEQMARTQQDQNIDAVALDELRDIRDTRMEVLLDLGRKQGIQKGIQKGREEGREEIAAQMLRDGLALEQISRWTGLSEEALERLRERLQSKIGL